MDSAMPTAMLTTAAMAVRLRSYWPLIYETQGSYASRIVRTPTGETVLTELGKHLQREQQAAREPMGEALTT